ncbi:MAG: DUF4065 domain-containing protein [Candidatus Adiutrix sp.]|jgi:uncharacterized phage-associated protein|nr:DUF4065 domain-containing protein [Candidatus Adiutrix sp.]
MATVFQVADYFLNRNNLLGGDRITALKLQKLVYFAQGYALATLGRPLFDELMYAWEHGPVCVALYNKYKKTKDFEAAPLEPVYESAAEAAKALKAARKPFTSEETSLLENILACYGDYTAGALSRMSHQTTPWQKAFPGRLIKRDSMKSFFSDHFKADKVEIIPLTRAEADEIANKAGVGLQ